VLCGIGNSKGNREVNPDDAGESGIASRIRERSERFTAGEANGRAGGFFPPGFSRSGSRSERSERREPDEKKVDVHTCSNG
jgi:hypothetical protein